MLYLFRGDDRILGGQEGLSLLAEIMGTGVEFRQPVAATETDLTLTTDQIC
jgi:hypothetical protein